MKTKLWNSLMAAALAFVLVVGGVGCATSHPSRTDSQYSSDKDLQSRVVTALEEYALYKYDNVNINTYKGTVQLSGFALTEEQSDRAGEIAENVSGVNEVVNNITVRR
jgi:osmotically-inducible protein OsmY